MQTYLGDYKQAAKNRNKKLIRAIRSVLRQSYSYFELIIISDGCDDSSRIVLDKFSTSKKIRCYQIDKQSMFSGIPRNTGIDLAKGDTICYLDNDDMFGEDHLKIIIQNMGKNDWIWFNDLIWNRDKKHFKERDCNLSLYRCGTSNIAHRNIARWNPHNAYGVDDWQFIRNLIKASNNHIKTRTAEYCVCHIPGVNGYDI